MSTLTADPVAASPAEQTDSRPPAPPAAPARRPRRLHLWLLLAITALGFVLRFSFPTRPLLWGDDAYTVYRTHSDFESMLFILQSDGFMPLHYELYWLMARAKVQEQPVYREAIQDYARRTGGPTAILLASSPSNNGIVQPPLITDALGYSLSSLMTHGTTAPYSAALSPAVVRMLPAFWGALMPPAIYFLAVQLLRRRVALVAALIAACSAYLLGYSRDGKMYMMLWSFTALSTACLLWWLNSGLRIAWLAWVASSLGMCSAHMTGPAMLVLQPIFLLTHPKVHWRNGLLFILGLGIILPGPIAYDRQFNKWFQEYNQDFGFDVEGLGWVVRYNAGRTGADLVRYTAPAYLFSWEWPKPVSEALIAPWLLTSLKIATVVLLLLAAAGAMPWSRRLRGLAPVATAGSAAGPEPSSPCSMGGTPPAVAPMLRERPCEPRPDENAQPWWRLLLWLGLWMVVPVYFVYCRSMTDFVSPRYWWDLASSTIAGPQWQDKAGHISPWFWMWIGISALAVSIGVFLLPAFRRALVWLIPGVAGAMLLIYLLRLGAPAEQPVHTASFWVLYFAQPLNQWWDWLTQPIIATALVVLLPGLLVYYCGQSWSQRLLRILGFAVVSAVIITACVGVYHWAQNEFNERLLKVLKAGGITEVAKASSLQLEKAKAALTRPGGDWQTIFMPRYFGFVWIAFCIALAALYMRLPTRPLRIAAVLLIVGINLAQFGGRLFAGTEPPLDRVAADIWRYDSHNSLREENGRTYVNDGGISDEVLGGAGHPACGTLEGQQGKYCLGYERGYWKHPTEWRMNSSRYFDFFGAGGRGRGLDYDMIVRDLGRNPKITRVVVWDKVVTDPKAPPRFDASRKPIEPWSDRTNELASMMDKAGFKKLGEVEAFPVRFHWEWKQLYTYVRMEFGK